jgi:hypothetical protein
MDPYGLRPGEISSGVRFFWTISFKSRYMLTLLLLVPFFLLENYLINIPDNYHGCSV